MHMLLRAHMIPCLFNWQLHTCISLAQSNKIVSVELQVSYVTRKKHVSCIMLGSTVQSQLIQSAKSSVYDIVKILLTYDCKKYSKIKRVYELLCVILPGGVGYILTNILSPWIPLTNHATYNSRFYASRSVNIVRKGRIQKLKNYRRSLSLSPQKLISL